jgi:uncharacterized membrane protein
MDRPGDRTTTGASAPGADRPHAGFGVLAVLGTVAYFACLHQLIVARAYPLVVLALVLAPWAVAAVAFAVRAARSATGVRRAAIVVASGAVIVGATWSASRYGSGLAARADLVIYGENIAFFAWLAGLFGITLFHGREPLVTRMARKVRRGHMPPSVVRYTRRVTAGWTLFFVAEIVVASVLFFGASREAWSLFVNLLIWPVVGLGFVVEFAIRRVVLRDVGHESIADSFRAFRDLDAERSGTRDR